MKTITVKYGSEVRNVIVNENTTIAQIIADPTTRVVLGYGDNVRALVNSVEMPGDAIPGNGTIVSLETRANSKAN